MNEGDIERNNKKIRELLSNGKNKKIIKKKNWNSQELDNSMNMIFQKYDFFKPFKKGASKSD